MQVTVNSFGMIRNVLGHKTTQVDVPEGATVLSVVSGLAEQGGQRAKNLILTPDGKALKIVVMMNGRSTLADTTVTDGSELNLMLTIGGGQRQDQLLVTRNS